MWTRPELGDVHVKLTTGPNIAHKFIETKQRKKTHERKYQEPYENKAKRLESQGGKCAGCETIDPGVRGWQTDHNHKTGVPRGELCLRCNIILGYAQDDSEVLYRLIDYLVRTS